MQELAILGGRPLRVKPYPPYNTIGQGEKAAALKVLDSGALSGFVATPGPEFNGGEHVKGLEADFCRYFGSPHAVSFNSATSALHACLAAGKLDEGDEVIVSPYTMCASATAAIMCGATPVFVDIEPDYFCLKVEHVAAAITNRTKAIVAVNIFGQPADLEPLAKLSKQNNLFLIEDNSQAPGARYKGKFTGTIGHMGVFSFNRHKTIQCGEGGIVISNNPELAYRLQLVRNHGEAVQGDLPIGKQQSEHFDIIGFNYRLTELQAAITRPQFARLEQLNNHRVELAEYFTERLKEYSFLLPPKIRNNCSHVYYLYPMIYQKEYLGISRDVFVKAIVAEGIPIANYVQPLYRLPIYRTKLDGKSNYNADNFPIVEDLWKNKMITTFICRPPLSKVHIDEFFSAIEKISEGANRLKNLDCS
jgi:dTDP-4-amino-4,6-dideoxygalactose transaminase